MDRKPKLTLKQGRSKTRTPRLKPNPDPPFGRSGFSPLVSSMSFKLLPRDYNRACDSWKSMVFGVRALRWVPGFPLFQGEFLAPTLESA